ncbi:hypothetical protein HanPSC8_Chr17g0753911 [Helianthus annuus]|nr:hypothetical protein HanPSC8_Chr17g0753911 [Helianthus annuus]
MQGSSSPRTFRSVMLCSVTSDPPVEIFKLRHCRYDQQVFMKGWQLLWSPMYLIFPRPVNEPNEHEHRHVRVRSFNFNRTRPRTYNQTHFFVRVRSLRNRACSCSFMFVRLKPK